MAKQLQRCNTLQRGCASTGAFLLFASLSCFLLCLPLHVLECSHHLASLGTLDYVLLAPHSHLHTQIHSLYHDRPGWVILGGTPQFQEVGMSFSRLQALNKDESICLAHLVCLFGVLRQILSTHPCQQALRTSKFCLATQGAGHGNRQAVGSLAGCLPVIIGVRTGVCLLRLLVLRYFEWSPSQAVCALILHTQCGIYQKHRMVFISSSSQR